jgi:hypothetical protein
MSAAIYTFLHVILRRVGIGNRPANAGMPRAGTQIGLAYDLGKYSIELKECLCL